MTPLDRRDRKFNTIQGRYRFGRKMIQEINEWDCFLRY